jgi:hypothetical protein
MLPIQELRYLIRSLEDAIAQLDQQGDRISGYWIDTATNRKGKLYHRLRWFEGKRRRAKVLQDSEVAKYQAMIKRGDQVTKLQQQLDEARKELERVEAFIKSLGGSIP